jgi:hypothetical protein
MCSTETGYSWNSQVPINRFCAELLNSVDKENNNKLCDPRHAIFSISCSASLRSNILLTASSFFVNTITFLKLKEIRYMILFSWFLMSITVDVFENYDRGFECRSKHENITRVMCCILLCREMVNFTIQEVLT